LFLHDLGDCAVELVRHVFRIDRLARLALDQQLCDGVVARQAADMRGQNAVAAGEHGSSVMAGFILAIQAFFSAGL
jgi:hypothetical protein